MIKRSKGKYIFQYYVLKHLFKKTLWFTKPAILEIYKWAENKCFLDIDYDLREISRNSLKSLFPIWSDNYINMIIEITVFVIKVEKGDYK